MQMNRLPEGTARRQRKEKRLDGKIIRSSAQTHRKTACPPLPDLRGVASANDCTGILPALPPEEGPEN